MQLLMFDQKNAFICGLLMFGMVNVNTGSKKEQFNGLVSESLLLLL